MATRKMGGKPTSKDGNQPSNPKAGAYERSVPGSTPAQPRKKPKATDSKKK